MNRWTYHSLAFLLGALYGWIGDGGHVYTKVLSYPVSTRFWWPGLAWWVLPQFGFGGLLLSLLVRDAMSRVLKRHPTYAISKNFPTYAEGFFALCIALATYLLSSYCTHLKLEQRTISFTLLGATLFLALFLELYQRHYMLVFGVVAWTANFGGIAWESSLCYLGHFKYTHPDKHLLVNHWIGFLWVGAVWAGIFPCWRYEWEVQHPIALAEHKKKEEKKGIKESSASSDDKETTAEDKEKPEAQTRKADKAESTLKQRKGAST